MGRQQIKGKKGRRANLIRHDKVLERVALPDIDEFQRLCILRGVYPQVMPKEENSPFAYFHKKDLAMINSDPMAWFIRERAVWEKNAKKKQNRKEQYGEAAPKAPYAELIRSRYPSFHDALHDLDDALTVVALFAQLSGNADVPSERIAKCRRLLAEFHYYVARTNSLNAGFISVKGYYFMATIDGEKIMWLVPHNFGIPKDDQVNFKVMLDFLELYEHLVGFINASLFIRLQMKYPPTYNKEKWDQSFYIDAIEDVFPQEEPVIEAVDVPVVEGEQKSRMEAAFASVAVAEGEQEQGDEDEEPEEDKGIFSNFVFTIHHSVPRDPISFVIKSLGGRIVWDEDSNDESITHTIIDRVPRERFMKRTYAQPQWVFDSLNAKTVLPLDVTDGSYVPGKELPPHLSPFVGREVAEEGLGDDEREIIAGADDSDDDITEEIRMRAMEAEYADGIAKETGAEVQTMSKEDLKQMKQDAQQKRKEEKARLAAGTLTSKKKKLYDELKEKEDSRKNKKNKNVSEEVDDGLELDDKALAEEEDEEEEAAE